VHHHQPLHEFQNRPFDASRNRPFAATIFLLGFESIAVLVASSVSHGDAQAVNPTMILANKRFQSGSLTRIMVVKGPVSRWD
jgi:hypothetical protein